MKTMRVFPMVLLPALLLASAALAQPRQGMMNLRDQLNLTADQRKEIDAIHSSAMKEQIDVRAAIGKLRVELRDLTRAEAPNQSAIEKKIQEISALRTQAGKRRIDTWFRVNRLLTSDQQAIWKNALEHRALAGRRFGTKEGYRHGEIGARFEGRRGRMDGSGPHR